MDEPTPTLSATGLGLSRDGEPVFSSVSFEVPAGSALAIVGPSGIGKTSLLDCLGGLLTPDTGRVSVGGFVVTGQRDARVRRWRLREVGMVFQFAELLPELTLAENVQLPMLLAGREGRAARDSAREALDAVGIARLADRLPSRVSGGERQRAAIARAVAHGPRLILADEPTGSLNPALAIEVAGLLVGLARQRRTMLVLATHNLDVAALADATYAMGGEDLGLAG